jgi:hypothetical protein
MTESRHDEMEAMWSFQEETGLGVLVGSFHLGRAREMADVLRATRARGPEAGDRWIGRRLEADGAMPIRIAWACSRGTVSR